MWKIAVSKLCTWWFSALSGSCKSLHALGQGGQRLAREHFYPARERGLGNEILPLQSVRFFTFVNNSLFNLTLMCFWRHMATNRAVSAALYTPQLGGNAATGSQNSDPSPQFLVGTQKNFVITASKRHYQFNIMCHVTMQCKASEPTLYLSPALGWTKWFRCQSQSTAIASPTLRKRELQHAVPGWLCLINRSQPFQYFAIATPALQALRAPHFRHLQCFPYKTK